MCSGRHRGIWILATLAGAGLGSFMGCSTNTPGFTPPLTPPPEPKAATATAAPATTVSEENSTLTAHVQRIDQATGAVAINGADTRWPTTPFRIDWGDRTTSQNFFPATHIYTDLRRNYTVTITATYPDGTTQTVSVPVNFLEPKPEAPAPATKSRQE